MRKILTVDDSTSMRQMVRATLQSAGYDVVEAADGQDALEFARDSSSASAEASSSAASSCRTASSNSGAR